MSSVPGRESETRKPGRVERVARRLEYPSVVEAPRWVVILRQVVIFGLGVWIISYSVTATSKNIAYIITGLVLIGIIPVEQLLLAVSRRADQAERRVDKSP